MNKKPKVKLQPLNYRVQEFLFKIRRSEDSGDEACWDYQHKAILLIKELSAKYRESLHFWKAGLDSRCEPDGWACIRIDGKDKRCKAHTILDKAYEDWRGIL